MRQNKVWPFLAIMFLLLAWTTTGCDTPAQKSPVKVDRSKISRYLAKSEPTKYDVKVGVNLDNKIQLLGFDYSPKPVKQGKPYTVTFYYKVLAPVGGDFQFFGHFEPADGQRFRAKMDHQVAEGKYPTSQWQKGEIIRDVFRETMPEAFPTAKGVLWGGFYQGEKRMPIATADKKKGDRGDRAKMGVIELSGGEDTRRKLTVYKTKKALKIDGQLNEPAWKNASSTGYFVNVSGEQKVKPYTTAKFLWDDKNLYIAFINLDDDIWTNFTKTDDPLYREETTEVMIDADASGSTYYELQVNAGNVVYDAYFPARRKDMDLKWSSGIKSAVVLDGTLNQRDDKDNQWIVEMAIPLENIKDAKLPLTEGASWKLNLYRMERPKKRGTVAAMWSPTLVGDFHMLDRFGTITFTEKTSNERNIPAKASIKRPKRGDKMMAK